MKFSNISKDGQHSRPLLELGVVIIGLLQSSVLTTPGEQAASWGVSL